MPKRYLLALLLALAGCATHPPSHVAVAAGYCDPPLPYRYDPAFTPQADFAAALSPALLARYPRRSLLTANAVGLLPALQTLLALQEAARQHPGPVADLAALRQQQLIAGQVALVSSTVASLAAELDCEGERADQVANYLKALDDQRTQRLNVLSISVGAASGIGTTVIENKPGQYAFGIGGGLLAAGLSLLTLRQNGHTVEFEHPRNLLGEVWAEKPATDLFPPSVWYMLSNPAFSNSGQTSIIHNTRQRWQRYGQLDQPNSKQGKALASLLFGPGGQYSADQLTVRANMLNELQSAVRLLNQELQGLLVVLKTA
ncbi:hypothetical protein GCM10023172_04840 [Hymenobacter ginsengisoli]|uniref:Uncharacterized protein n=1 Tax=Hymenobacter ginsengisoli TaxID=1051626 RepID=A0ABP8PZG4_9BACT|nr:MULTISPECIES: hypothetical protein [unclassified Hymenobacter]MBO2030586.1 hypothetical protein [Hymenobacter sp. BT559]